MKPAYRATLVIVITLVVMFVALRYAKADPVPANAASVSLTAEIPAGQAFTPEVAQASMQAAITKNKKQSVEIFRQTIRLRKDTLSRFVSSDPKSVVVRTVPRLTCKEVGQLLKSAILITPDQTASLVDVAMKENPECQGNFKVVIESIPGEPDGGPLPTTPIFAFPPGPPSTPWEPVTPVQNR